MFAFHAFEGRIELDDTGDGLHDFVKIFLHRVLHKSTVLIVYTIIIHIFSRLVKEIRGKAEKYFFPLARKGISRKTLTFCGKCVTMDLKSIYDGVKMDEKQEEKQEEKESFGEFLAKLDLHGGHRKRLYERLAKGGLCDHEYLEALLFSGLTRRNTNDLAHLLLSEFGDIRGVLTAPIERLRRVDGVGESLAAFIRTVGILVEKFASYEQVYYPSHYRADEFVRFLREEYASYGFEVLDVYLLDDVGRIHGRQRYTSGREKRVEVQLRWLMNVLLDFNPSGIVLVHNHPKGDCKPSASDDMTTEECRALCEKNGVIFCDHLIYSPEGIYSYHYERQIRDNQEATEGLA